MADGKSDDALRKGGTQHTQTEESEALSNIDIDPAPSAARGDCGITADSNGDQLEDMPGFNVAAEPIPQIEVSRAREDSVGNPQPMSGALPEDAEGVYLATGVHSVPQPTQPKTPHRLSPLAPKSANRNRGYSLRRSIFNRNIQDKSEEDGDLTVELEELSRSSSRNDPRTMNKKEPSIILAPIQSSNGSQTMKSNTGSALPHYEKWVKKRSKRGSLKSWPTLVYRGLKRSVFRIQELQPTKHGRQIHLDAPRKLAAVDERTGHPYISNTIRSSRHTPYNFLPKQLFAQFSKLANFYFLCVSILQLIPTLSTTGQFTTLVPLMFFVSISIAKEGYDDLRRYRLDKEENRRNVDVLHPPEATSSARAHSSPDTSLVESLNFHWTSTKWQDVKVADIVRIKRNQAIPADMILLHAEEMNGIAYIETMALDGETNLKSKQPAPLVAKNCEKLEGISTCQALIVVEDPNLDLYNFEGKVTIHDETQPLTNSDVIYRGSVLRNTEIAYGMIIYTGEECKIRMNANKNPRVKAPALQARVNRIVIVIAIFVLCLAIFNTVAYQIWFRTTERRAWYLIDAKVPFGTILASFIILFNTMLPLSLYVSLEIVKVFQIFLMNDIDMYDPVSNTPMEPRTSTINEDLGQISYIFSDKTGTLTDNSMRFRKLSVAGTSWLHDFDLQKEAALRGDTPMLMHKKRKEKKHIRRSTIRTSTDVRDSLDHSASHPENPEIARKSSTAQRQKSTVEPMKTPLEHRTEDLVRYVQQKPNTVFARKAKFLLLSIALCNTCIPEQTENGQIDFQAASPDELALVRAAQEMGYMIVDRQAKKITLKSFPDGRDEEPFMEEYEILDVIEFSSKRKRMSIILRFPNGHICVLCKGADSTIMQLLKRSELAIQKANEVDQRARVRKSIDVQQAISRRESMALPRKGSTGRPSMSLVGRNSVGGRNSTSGLPRPSITATRLQSVRGELDNWLQERTQHDGRYSEDMEGSSNSPRRSVFHGNRPSFAVPESRGSFQQEMGEALSDDSLVVDEGVVFERTFQHVNDFATDGLRTLLYGYRYVDLEEYSSWKKVWLEATTSLNDRQIMIEHAGDLIERDFDLAGATAIEDKLQAGVPEAIDKLRRANIKLWMLTGDKRETAINIGYSCRLILEYSTVTVLDYTTGGVEKSIAATILDISAGKVAHSVCVIDGQTLGHIEANETLKELFFELAISVDSVICCRASPSQKALLVHTIRKKVNKSVTLAIGDGANDIAMIQEAHVGIGITGKEGLQAARTSDYSIAQFRFLLKLLLVHGRWNYIRTCKYTVGTFWKEMLFYLTQALYQRWVGYTGTSLYESWSLSMFNTLFTSLPVIFLGVFEKDLSASTLLAVPELYNRGQRSLQFNLKVYLFWMFMAASEAVVVFFVMLSLYGRTLFTKDNGLFAMGTLTYTAAVTMINLKLLTIEMHNKSIVTAIGFILSVGGWYIFTVSLSGVYKNNVVYNVKGGFLHRFGNNILWWLVLILIVTAFIVFEISVKTVKARLLPSDVEVFQQLEKDPEIKRRFEEDSAAELQQGWDRGKKKTSLELEREKIQVEGEFMHWQGDEEDGSPRRRGMSRTESSANERKLLDIREKFAWRFGSVTSK